MRKYRIFHRFIIVTLILSFVSVNQALPQTQYRKPSNSDIEWILGKSSNRTHYDFTPTAPCEPVCQNQPTSHPGKLSDKLQVKSKDETSMPLTKPENEITQTSATIEVSDDFTDDFPKGIPLDEILPASMKAPTESKTQVKNIPAPKLAPKAAASKCLKPLEELPEKKSEIACDSVTNQHSCQHGYKNNCSQCCNERYEDCVTSRPLLNLFRSSSYRGVFVTRHENCCCCWLCTDLDIPDMIGDAAWIPERAVRLTSGGNKAELSAPTAIVSRLNIAEHFNAEARNRLWFDFRHLNNAMSLKTDRFQQSRAVDQFTFGLETCVTNNLSAEFRVPVINQFNSRQADFASGNQLGGSDSELGNLSLIFKYVLCRSANMTIAGGLGIVFPTAEDWRAPTTASAALWNKSYYLVPYLGLQWHPNENTFGHFLVQTDVPVSDNTLRFGNESLDVKEPAAVRLGWQLGRWFYRNEYGSHSCRLGGFLELDYTITSGCGKFGGISHDIDNNIYIGSLGGKPQPVNLALGMPILFGQFMITNAVMLPLTDKDSLFSIGYNFSLSRRF